MVYNGTLISAINGGDMDELNNAYCEFTEISGGWGILKTSITDHGIVFRRIER